MHICQGKFFALLMAGFMLISILPFQNLAPRSDSAAIQESKNESSVDAPSASQHNLTTPYTYKINDIESSVVYNGSIFMAKEFQVHGEYLFYIRDETNLGVLNISNPEDPRDLGYITFATPIVHFQAIGTVVYIATSNSIFQVDISNPANMQIITAFSGYSGDILTFLVVDWFLYLIVRNQGYSFLQIFKEYSWNGASYLSNYTLGTQIFRRMVSYQYYLLLGNDNGFVQQFVVFDPTSPTYTTQISLINNIISMKVFGNYLFVADSSYFSIINPTSLSVYQQLSISNVVGYSIQGNLGYFASFEGKIFIINMTDITRMNAIASLDFTTTLYGLEIFGNIIFVSTISTFYGIKAARMLEEPLNQLTYPGLTVDKVRIFGYYAYLCTSDELKIFDLRNNQIVGSYSHAGQAVRDCYQNGNLLYVLFEDSVIRYLNIENPSNPSYVNELNTGLSNAWALRASGKFLFACFLQSGVQIINMTNQNSLSIASTIGNEPGSFAYDCAIDNDILYIVNYNQLCVYDIKMPKVPLNLVNISTSFIFSADISYPFLFVGTTIGYTVYNISLNTPTWVMGFDTGGSNTMCIKRCGEYLLLGAAGSGIKMAVVKSTNAMTMKYNNMSGSIYGLDAFCDKMILAKDTDGFSVSKIRETPLDFSDGVPFLEKFWGNTSRNETLPTTPPSEKPEDGQIDPSPFDWNSLLTYGGPPLAIFAIIYVIVKSKGKGGPKAKKIKAMTKNQIKKAASSNQDDFFDSDF